MKNFVICENSIGKYPIVWSLLFIVLIAKSSSGLFLSWAHLNFSLSVGTKLFYKSGNHEQELETWIFCCNPCWWKLFCLCFFARRWCDSNVMLLNNKYIQKSLRSNWGEKNKALQGILMEHFLYETNRENVIYFLLLVIDTWFIARFFSNCLFLSNKVLFIFELSNETCDEIS